MRVRLEVNLASRPTGYFEHEGPSIHIGRDPASEMALDNTYEGVSWQHARIDLTPAGAILYDVGSTNGTFVNEERVTLPVRLRIGDAVRLGLRGPQLTLVALLPSGTPGSAAPTSQVDLPEMAPYVVSVATPGRARSAVVMPSFKRPSLPRPALALRMLAAVRDKQRRRFLYVVVAAALLLVALIGAVLLVQVFLLGMLSSAGKPGSGEAAPPSGQPGDKAAKEARPDIAPVGLEVYKKATRSAVLVVSKQGSGTGAIINAERKLVVTPYHVLSGSTEAMVYFPAFDSAGKVITDRKHYKQHATPVVAKLVASDPQSDLAVLELSFVPEACQAVPVAAGSASPGDRVHMVSSAEASDNYWVYGTATVRKQLKLPSGQSLDCWMVDLDNAGTPAESGAPLLTEAGELVGVHSSGRVGAIDIRELTKLAERIR